MKHNIIKTDNYLLVVDDSEIKEGDYTYHHIKGIYTAVVDGGYTNQKKIIAHLPLNNSPILQGVDLLPPLEDNVIGKPMYDYVNEKHNQDRCMGFIDGYNKAKEKYKFTEEDMRKAFLSGVGITGEGYNAEYSDGNDPDIETEFGEQADKFIQSLSQPKIPVGFSTLDQWYNPKTNKAGYSLPEVSGLNDNDGCYMIHSVITNSQGQIEWVGNYVY